MALIFPTALTMRRDNAKLTCQGNLKQIHRALKAYWLDYQAYPPFDMCNGDATDTDPLLKRGHRGLMLLYGTREGGMLAGAIKKTGYLKSYRTLHCPADPQVQRQKFGGLLHPANYSSYQVRDPDSADPGDRFTYLRTRLWNQAGCNPLYDGVDNDEDGKVDEDPADGLDNDLDLEIDEDCGKAGTCAIPSLVRRQLGLPRLPPSAVHPDDSTVVTWCLHHRSTLKRGGEPADIVLFAEGSIKIWRGPRDSQGKPNGIIGWRRTQTKEKQ